MKKILIVSPAKKIEGELIDFAVDFLRKNNFQVEVLPHAKSQFNYFSGTDEERLTDFQKALNDENADVILCSRGGYGSVRIIDKLDFSQFVKKPKLIVGFSDVTVFHSHIQTNFNIPTVHATVPLNFQTNSNESLETLLKVFNRGELDYTFPSSNLNRIGDATGIIVGGNLSILCSLLGSKSDIDTNGKILFIEDVSEAVYAVDRMMMSLKRAGKLNSLSGLMVGGFTHMKDSEIPFGKTVEEVIKSAVSEFNFPVAFNFPAGHQTDNRAIILGQSGKLRVNENASHFFQHSPKF